MYVGSKTIARVVAIETGVPVEDILSRNRYRGACLGRQLTCWVARRMAPKRTVVAIARQLGIDHSTVVHGVQSVEARMAASAWWLAIAERVLATVRMLEAGDPTALRLLAGGVAPDLRHRRYADLRDATPWPWGTKLGKNKPLARAASRSVAVSVQPAE